MKAVAISIFKTEAGYFVPCSETGQINARRTIREKVAELEEMYENKHRQSYVGSMSACVAYIQFQPSVVRLSPEDIIKAIPKKMAVMVSGENMGFTAVQLDPVEGALLWERGVKPKLIGD